MYKDEYKDFFDVDCANGIGYNGNENYSHENRHKFNPNYNNKAEYDNAPIYDEQTNSLYKDVQYTPPKQTIQSVNNNYQETPKKTYDELRNEEYYKKYIGNNEKSKKESKKKKKAKYVYDKKLALHLATRGFFGIGGLHDFYMRHYITGTIKLFTCNFCFIGTIIDCIRIMTNHYKEIQE